MLMFALDNSKIQAQNINLVKDKNCILYILVLNFIKFTKKDMQHNMLEKHNAALN